MIDPSWYQRPEGTPEHLTAGGVVIRSEADGLLVALVREGDYPAYILPKGRVEPGESLVQAAIREIAEEAGLTGLEYLGYLGTQERLNYGKRIEGKLRHSSNQERVSCT
jgi:8-oxo-dGTP pyrophosphatase MutT (NUDIX family)